MGPCTSKQTQRKDIKKVSFSKKTEVINTNNGPSLPLLTLSPNQEAVSESAEDKKKIKKPQIKILNNSFSRTYSLISQGNIKLLDNQKLVQHNLTGKIRIIEIYEKNQINEDFVNSLAKEPLDHPNIAQVHEVFIDGETITIAIDYCSGGLLSDYYNEKLVVPFTEQEIASMIYQIGHIVEYLSHLSLFHGTLTLQSFSRVDASGDCQIKLTDLKSLFVKQDISLNNVISLSPESLDNEDKQSKQREIWAIGIIAYQMICGYPPFEGNTIEQVKYKIKKMAVDYQNFHFDRTSKYCKQFVSRILQPYKQRPILRDLLLDQWFKIRPKQNSQNVINILSSNKIKTSQLQQFILQIMIKHFSSSEQQALHRQFVELDENGDGQISKQELLKVYSNKFSNKSEAEEFVENIFKIADVDKSGSIDFGEFIVAITDKKGLVTNDNLKVIFKLLSSANGKLTTQRLRLQLNLTQEKVDSSFQEHFPNKKFIQFQEFEQLMKQLLF